jgi:hypothetical protein
MATVLDDFARWRRDHGPQYSTSSRCTPKGHSENTAITLVDLEIIHRILELLGHDDLLPRCKLLKSKTRLAELQRLWRLICDNAGWQYIELLPADKQRAASGRTGRH